MFLTSADICTHNCTYPYTDTHVHLIKTWNKSFEKEMSVYAAIGKQKRKLLLVMMSECQREHFRWILLICNYDRRQFYFISKTDLTFSSSYFPPSFILFFSLLSFPFSFLLSLPHFLSHKSSNSCPLYGRQVLYHRVSSIFFVFFYFNCTHTRARARTEYNIASEANCLCSNPDLATLTTTTIHFVIWCLHLANGVTTVLFS